MVRRDAQFWNVMDTPLTLNHTWSGIGLLDAPSLSRSPTPSGLNGQRD